MGQQFNRNRIIAGQRLLWALGAATATLSACGGGAEAPATVSLAVEPAAATASATAETLPPADATVQPTFHVAPVTLDEPADADVVDNSASARQAPQRTTVPGETAQLRTRGLTLQGIASAQRRHALSASGAAGGTVAPMAGTSAVTTYTPAQIRAAYGLPALPLAGTTPTALQAAQLGAGQTIYIVDAMHDPNAAAELAAFNTKFGLPACTAKVIGVTTALPLAAPAAGSGCTFSVVYSTPAGGMTATAPAFDAGWATEIALDVQWAHATAPLARIVLIEAADATTTSLLGAVKLANAMGPGAVSMSFGGNEGNWTTSVDSAFAGAGMTYLAATGDSGAGVSWPAVSPRVVAVGGTTLAAAGVGTRSETGWSSGGGGISAYVATPAWQANTVPGVGTLAHRAVADVAFNANPSTGQYVAVIAPGGSTASWLSAGGTSLSTPQWAGIIAMANAVRAQSAKAALGAPHELLYRQIASVPGTYAAAFGDITAGANGSCATCIAKTGFDTVTGLGTPNVSALLAALSGAATTPTPAPAPTPVATAPVVSSASVAGKVGTALSFKVTATAPNALTWSLTGAPAGMAIASTGTLSWASPVAGTYAVTVSAKDTTTGLSGQGIVTVTIAPAAPPPSAPVIKAAALTGVAGKALSGSFSVSSTSSSVLRITITGVPAGMGFTVSGQTTLIQWAKPVTGQYALAITVADAAGLSSKATIPVTITTK